jgi:hypothetical protein
MNITVLTSSKVGTVQTGDDMIAVNIRAYGCNHHIDQIDGIIAARRFGRWQSAGRAISNYIRASDTRTQCRAFF